MVALPTVKRTGTTLECCVSGCGGVFYGGLRCLLGGSGSLDDGKHFEGCGGLFVEVVVRW